MDNTLRKKSKCEPFQVKLFNKSLQDYWKLIPRQVLPLRFSEFTFWNYGTTF